MVIGVKGRLWETGRSCFRVGVVSEDFRGLGVAEGKRLTQQGGGLRGKKQAARTGRQGRGTDGQVETFSGGRDTGFGAAGGVWLLPGWWELCRALSREQRPDLGGWVRGVKCEPESIG